MAAITELRGKRLYLDANVFIYALEGLEPWRETAQGLLLAVDRGECSAVTSELTLAECLVKPLQLGQVDNAQVFDRAIQSRSDFEVVPVLRPILVDAARLRARNRVRLADAIHAVTAIRADCQAFVTNDQFFSRVPELRPMLLSQLTTR